MPILQVPDMSWSRDGRCGQVVLVETSRGRWPRPCLDAHHQPGTDHHLHYDGVVVPVTDGLTRIHLDTPPVDVDQPVLV